MKVIAVTKYYNERMAKKHLITQYLRTIQNLKICMCLNIDV